MNSPIYILGGGVAGLFASLKLAPLPVVVVSPFPLGDGTASGWAQGGIAAAIGADDSPALHIADTLATGAGLCDEVVVSLMAHDAAARIDDLVRYGVPFDRDENGNIALGLEAAHSRRRIAHISGDRAGASIMSALVKAVRAADHITLYEGFRVLSLDAHDNHLNAICLMDAKNHQQWLPAHTAILATGGIGSLYHVTTNPPGAHGNGIAMAANIGATLADMEFVQFHPTALAIGVDPAPLATEALRGEGAWLVNGRGERFMQALDDRAELAPRDVVARAIHRQMLAGEQIFLDTRSAIGGAFPDHFPTVYAACRRAGIDPLIEPIPVSPAAHYHIGGVATDRNARTSVQGLYACGEVAATGAHGANRLASNSLLESMVFAHRAAQDILSNPMKESVSEVPTHAIVFDAHTPPDDLLKLRRTMLMQVGIERDAKGLSTALDVCDELAQRYRDTHPIAPMLKVCRGIITAALARTESRGCHFRTDFPELDEGQACDVLAISNRILMKN